MKKRNHRSAEFKASVALAALRGEETIAELSLRYSVHSTQILSWKSAAVKKLSSVFSSSSKQEVSADLGQLERKIGQLTMENDFLKKAWEGYQVRKGGL